MSIDFRQMARNVLAKGVDELRMGDDRLSYAALNLRMAIEALTYERAQAYEKYIPADQIAAWQPRRIMEALIEIDPAADVGATLYMAGEDTPGEQPKEVLEVGTEHILTLATIKKHYDALGSLVHLPTLKQLQKGDVSNRTSLRKRCEEISASIEQVLSSTIFNMNIGGDFEFDCRKCGKLIVRRTPLRPFKYKITCSNCEAQYWVQRDGEEKIRCAPISQRIDCLVEKCDGGFVLWQNEVKIGNRLKCDVCGAVHQLGLTAELLAPLCDDSEVQKNQRTEA